MVSFNLGQGVRINSKVNNETEQKTKKEALAKIMAKGKWGPKPVIQNQYTQFPSTAKREALQVAVFNISNKENLKELNAFLEKTNPPEAPEILVIEQEKYFSDQHNELTYLIKYFPISYLQLDTKGFQLLSGVN
jgi:hypothetical protein